MPPTTAFTRWILASTNQAQLQERAGIDTNGVGTTYNLSGSTNLPYLGLNDAARDSVTNAALKAAMDATNNAALTRDAELAAGSIPVAASGLTGTIDDARLPGTITSDITGNAATVTSIAGNATQVVAIMGTNDVSDYPLPIYNVKLPPFNAVGNGVANDTAALRLASDYAYTNGGTVFLPLGTYNVKYPGATTLGSPPSSGQNEASIVPFRGTNIAVVGASRDGTTVRIATDEPASQHMFGVWGKNITFANFTLDGNASRLGDVVETNGTVLVDTATNYTWGAVTPAEGFYVTNMPDEDAITPQYYFENVLIKNMEIKNWANEGVDIAPYFDAAILPEWMVRIQDCKFTSNYGYAIEAAVATIVERGEFVENSYLAWPAATVGSLGNRARNQMNCDPYQSVVRDSFFHGGYGGIGQLGGSNAGTNASYGLLAEGNYFFNQTNASIRIGDFVSDAFPSVLRNNHFTITNATGWAIDAGNPGTLIDGGSVKFPAGANRLAVNLSGDGTTLRGMTITNGYINGGVGRITIAGNTVSTPGVCIYLPSATSRFKDIIGNTLVVSATGSHYAPVDAQGSGSATTNPDNIRYLFNTLISSNNAGGGRGLLVTSSNVVIGNHISGSVIYGIQFATGDSNSIVMGNQIYAGSTARVQIDAGTFGTHTFSGNLGSQIGDTYVGNGGGITNVILVGPTNATLPANELTPVAWANFTNSTGGTFKLPLYQ